MKVNVPVVMHALLSSLLAEMKVGGSRPNIISSKRCYRCCLQELSVLTGSNQHSIPKQCSQPEQFRIEPSSPPCQCIFLPVSTFCVTCWGLVQAQDQAEEASRKRLKAVCSSNSGFHENSDYWIESSPVVFLYYYKFPKRKKVLAGLNT